MSTVPYASVVGSLMYTMVCTMPDITQAVSMVSRYMHDLGKSNWHAVKWILRHLKGSSDVGLQFENRGQLISYVSVMLIQIMLVIWISDGLLPYMYLPSQVAPLVGGLYFSQLLHCLPQR